MIPKMKVNEPPFKLIDIMSEVTTDINSKLRIPGKEVIEKDLKFRFGYYTELIAELNSENSPGFDSKKYPFLWLVQPFTIVSGVSYDYFGEVKDYLRMFLVMESSVTYKAKEREDITFDPMLYPIYLQLIKSMKDNVKLRIPVATQLKHEATVRYYWGDDQKQVIPDIADCIDLKFYNIIINNNLNCP